MMEELYSAEHQERAPRVPEARYAYYRRCQAFRKGGQQCKAPAEKGSHICHAHAEQLAMAVRRERELRAVLEEAVAQMRRRGKPDCEMANLFMDFKGINMTLAVMAQAVITGKIDCKTAGRLVVQLQTTSKLLWMMHRKGRERRRENGILPQICAEDGRLDKPGEKPNLTTEACGEQPRTASSLPASYLATNCLGARDWAMNEREERRIALVRKVLAVADRRSWAHAPPELLRAA